MTSTAPVRRHRIESCERITLTHLRPGLAPGATQATPPGGGVVALLWRPCRRTYGDRGLALLMLCPRCSSPRRDLWRPPGESFACSACHPLIWPSQRRSGSRSGNGKPRSYELDRIVSAQRLCADRLGVAWPPERIIWSSWDLPRLPKASRLSAHRQWMLSVTTASPCHCRQSVPSLTGWVLRHCRQSMASLTGRSWPGFRQLSGAPPADRLGRHAPQARPYGCCSLGAALPPGRRPGP
jgi:hypothetical protein